MRQLEQLKVNQITVSDSAPTSNMATNRLFEDHRRRDAHLLAKQKQAENAAKAMAHPSKPFQNFQKLSPTDGKKIVERLLGYKSVKNGQIGVTKGVYTDPECTFKPRINRKSKQMSNKTRCGKLRRSVDGKLLSQFFADLNYHMYKINLILV